MGGHPRAPLVRGHVLARLTDLKKVPAQVVGDDLGLRLRAVPGVSRRSDAATTASAADDEEHEGDDRQDDQDGPQHGASPSGSVFLIEECCRVSNVPDRGQA